MVKTTKVAFAMVFKISRGIHIMTRYDKIVIKSDISETILNMVPGCVPFKIVSDSPTLHSRWLLFFKVMIISL
jgi:hypothetical protein